MKKCLLPFIALLLLPVPVFSMHIAEGFLPASWALFWWAAAIPFLWLSIARLRRLAAQEEEAKMLIAMAAAFIFFLSALKLPSVTGSSSHATGVGLGTLLFGPLAMVVLGFLVLLFQALLLAHGGLSTLGANALSMAVAGPVAAYAAWRALSRLRLHRGTAIFIAAALGDLATYAFAALQLALAHPDAGGGVTAGFLKFAGIFGLTQVPIALGEGLLTVAVMNILARYAVGSMLPAVFPEIVPGGGDYARKR